MTAVMALNMSYLFRKTGNMVSAIYWQNRAIKITDKVVYGK